MRMQLIAGIVSGVTFLWMPAALQAVDGTPSWVFSSVTAAPASDFYVSSPSLAFDHYGTPAVSWSLVSQSSGVNTVNFAQLLGLGLWSTHQLAPATADSGLLTSLAFDRSERPVVAWVNANGTVQASFNLGAAQSVGSSAATARPIIDISYDLAGTLRGMFARTSTGNFFDIRHSGSSFSSVDMATISGFSSLHDAALVTDGRGLRHMALRGALSGGGQGVIIASEPSTAVPWPSAVLASASNIYGVDIAMDPGDGRVALAYTTFDSGSNTSKLFYSKFTGSFLQTIEVYSSTLHRFEDVSLAFDPVDGRPAIAYERKVHSSSAEELHFAWQTSSSAWQSTLVDGTIRLDAPANRPRRPSLAFDDYGTSWPAIAYVDFNGSLAVAFDPPVPEPATPALLSVIPLLRRRRRMAG